MGETKQINIKNRTYYFYKDQIDLKDFDAILSKIDKKYYNEIEIYYIGYVTIKKIGDYNNIDSVSPLYLMINEMIGHSECNSIECNSVEEKNKNKYLEKYEEVWEGIKKEIKTINKGEKIEYGKDFKKIRFESNDDLSLNKPIKLRLLTIIIRSIFSENGKFYPQLFLDEAVYDLV